MTMWYLIYGIFKVFGLEYLGEEAIWRLAVFMAVTPFVILVMLLINEGREMRKREGYKKTDFNLYDTYDALTYPGTWNLLRKNFSFAINEYRRAFSKKLFLKTLQKMIPSLAMLIHTR